MSRLLNGFGVLALSLNVAIYGHCAAWPVFNPSCEQIPGAAPAHFDANGKLRDNHYSIVSGYPVEPTGFSSADPIPGWNTTSSAGIYNPPARLVPLEAPHGNIAGWVNVTGVIRQTLATNFEANTTYELTVEVGSLRGFGFPGYEVALFGADKTVAFDRSLAALAAPGRFGTARVSVWIGEDSPAVGAPIEIPLGPGGSGDSSGTLHVRPADLWWRGSWDADCPTGSYATIPLPRSLV